MSLQGLFPQRRKAAKQLKITAEHFLQPIYPPSCFAGLKFASVCFAPLRLCGKNILFSQPIFCGRCLMPVISFASIFLPMISS
jgi:hypothetical protein